MPFEEIVIPMAVVVLFMLVFFHFIPIYNHNSSIYARFWYPKARHVSYRFNLHLYRVILLAELSAYMKSLEQTSTQPSNNKYE